MVMPELTDGHVHRESNESSHGSFIPARPRWISDGLIQTLAPALSSGTWAKAGDSGGACLYRAIAARGAQQAHGCQAVWNEVITATPRPMIAISPVHGYVTAIRRMPWRWFRGRCGYRSRQISLRGLPGSYFRLAEPAPLIHGIGSLLPHSRAVPL